MPPPKISWLYLPIGTVTCVHWHEYVNLCSPPGFWVKKCGYMGLRNIIFVGCNALRLQVTNHFLLCHKSIQSCFSRRVVFHRFRTVSPSSESLNNLMFFKEDLHPETRYIYIYIHISINKLNRTFHPSGPPFCNLRFSAITKFRGPFGVRGPWVLLEIS